MGTIAEDLILAAGLKCKAWDTAGLATTKFV